MRNQRYGQNQSGLPSQAGPRGIGVSSHLTRIRACAPACQLASRQQPFLHGCFSFLPGTRYVVPVLGFVGWVRGLLMSLWPSVPGVWGCLCAASLRTSLLCSYETAAAWPLDNDPRDEPVRTRTTRGDQQGVVQKRGGGGGVGWAFTSSSTTLGEEKRRYAIYMYC